MGLFFFIDSSVVETIEGVKRPQPQICGKALFKATHGGSDSQMKKCGEIHLKKRTLGVKLMKTITSLSSFTLQVVTI